MLEAMQKIVSWTNSALQFDNKAEHMKLKARSLPVETIATLNANQITVEMAQRAGFSIPWST